jgi:hypothetical protein
MPRVGFEPTIPVFEGAKMVHALDRAATVLGFQMGLHGPIMKYFTSNEHRTNTSHLLYICFWGVEKNIRKKKRDLRAKNLENERMRGEKELK